MGQYGIDMGTSYIKVSKLKNGQVQSVNMNRGIMSILGTGNQIHSGIYLQENGDFLVGNAAYNVYKRNLSRYITQFKREIGQGTYSLVGNPILHRNSIQKYSDLYCEKRLFREILWIR